MTFDVKTTLNDQVIDIITSALITAKKNPDKEDFAADIIKKTLSEATQTNCMKVYITKGTDLDGNPVLLIPKMVSTVLSSRINTDYSLEINTSMYGNTTGYTAEEIALFIIHELSENILTDRTFMRFKDLITTYLTDAARNAYNNSRIRSLSSLLWISIFSRTEKHIIEERDTSFFGQLLKTYFSDKYVDIWNSTLKKFISINGGDPKILTPESIKYKDKSDLITFNKFAREYTSDSHCKYPGDYTQVTKYLLASNSSKLFKEYISTEPLFSGEYPGRDIFTIFDDTKIIYETVTGSNSKSYIKTYSELELDVANVETEADKLEVAVKLRAFNEELSKELETDICNTEVLQSLRSKTNSLIHKLKNIKADYSVMEEFI